MLLLLSPAKSLDYATPLPKGLAHTLPAFMPEHGAGLIDTLRTLAPQDVAALMSISDRLAALNVARYAAWQPEATRRQRPPGAAGLQRRRL